MCPGENIRVTRRDSDPGGPDGLREDLVLSVRRFGVVPVVIAEGTVDLRTGPQLAHVITAAVARQPADVVIDLTGVGFLSVTGLHVLLDARRAAGDRTRLRVLAARRASANHHPHRSGPGAGGLLGPAGWDRPLSGGRPGRFQPLGPDLDGRAAFAEGVRKATPLPGERVTGSVRQDTRATW